MNTYFGHSLEIISLSAVENEDQGVGGVIRTLQHFNTRMLSGLFI